MWIQCTRSQKGSSFLSVGCKCESLAVAMLTPAFKRQISNRRVLVSCNHNGAWLWSQHGSDWKLQWSNPLHQQKWLLCFLFSSGWKSSHWYDRILYYWGEAADTPGKDQEVTCKVRFLLRRNVQYLDIWYQGNILAWDNVQYSCCVCSGVYRSRYDAAC